MRRIKMKKLCLLLLVIGILNSGVLGVGVSIPATVSCRTEGGATNENKNMSDNNKLSVRATSNGNKSWIKFTGLTLDVSNLRTATLTVSLHELKAGVQRFDVSYVNDSCIDNINWAETAITWNNAPGNDTAVLGLLDSTKTTLLTTVNFTDGAIGQSFVINVLPALQADTDGIVQFVLHNSPNLLQLSTHDNATAAKRPVLNVTFIPEGADYPNPDNGARVETTLPSLSWTTPEPNLPDTPITCDVYLGYLLPGQTEPNRPQMDKVTLDADVTTVDINTTNFPNFGNLANNTTYYWFVDCHDSSHNPVIIPGEKWSFYTDNNEPPVVNAGTDQITWGLPKLINLDGTVTDDGLPTPALTYLWERIMGPATAVINSPTAVDTSVTITERGDYQFRLTASDGVKQTSDTVQIVVGTNACDASHLDTGAAYNAADQNQDCLVDISDLKSLIIDDWLHCTDTLDDCGN
jgi:hypothetical protein